MAESASAFKAELPSKPVQEIAKSCSTQVPERYIYKNGYPQAAHDSLPWMDTLLIDLSVLSSPSSSPAKSAELEKLKSALTSWGCFQVINHGMTSSFVDEVRHVTEQFFALPLDEKKKCSRKIDDHNGYGNDAVILEHQTLDWFDRLHLTVYPVDQRKPNFWPENPPKFRDIILEYMMNLKTILEVLLKAIAVSLKLEENRLLSEHGEQGKLVARFNFYPCCPNPEQVLGLKPHADGTTITMVLQDREVEGLQVLKDDEWFKVPIIPHAIFINAGDLAVIMSNGIVKSAVHRVVTNMERDRISLAVFCSPGPDAEIGPFNELITADRPQLYKKLKNYVRLFFQYYQRGERPINALKI